jgi:hypothetical protein
MKLTSERLRVVGIKQREGCREKRIKIKDFSENKKDRPIKFNVEKIYKIELKMKIFCEK